MNLKQILLETLIDLRDHGPKDLNLGICSNIGINPTVSTLDHIQMWAFDELLIDIMNKWPDHSGDRYFPVQHPTKTAEDAYLETVNMWEGEYGDNRWNLLDFLINYLVKQQ